MMIDVSCGELGRKIKTSRIIDSIEGEKEGPILIFTAGLHGNEPTGVFALKDVFNEIKRMGEPFFGKAIAVVGNLKALGQNKRFLKEDLNRIWTAENIRRVQNGFDASAQTHPELVEMYELYQILREHFNDVIDQEYFIDLHTTSAPTKPFIALSNLHGNLDFARKFSIPTISNIDNFLKAPMLAYANHTGNRHVSLAFEAGQHHHTEAYENHKHFIRLCFHHTGTLKYFKHTEEAYWQSELNKRTNGLHGRFEVIEHYLIEKGEHFVMQPGFQNFESVQAGDVLAESNGKPVRAKHNGNIFMPLYQKQGDDGFFIIREVPYP